MGLVVSEGWADEHDVIKPAAERAADLVHDLVHRALPELVGPTISALKRMLSGFIKSAPIVTVCPECSTESQI